jgi:hypothetical protein
MRAVRSLRVDSVLSSLTVAFQSFKNIFLASSSPNVLTAIVDEAYDTFRGIFPKVPYFTEDNIRAVLSVADHPKAASADPKEFFDNRFIKELEDTGFIKELYGQK